MIVLPSTGVVQFVFTFSVSYARSPKVERMPFDSKDETWKVFYGRIQLDGLFCQASGNNEFNRIHVATTQNFSP